jgi:hypothetical protein
LGHRGDESFLLRPELEVTRLIDVVWGEFFKPHGFHPDGEVNRAVRQLPSDAALLSDGHALAYTD